MFLRHLLRNLMQKLFLQCRETVLPFGFRVIGDGMGLVIIGSMAIGRSPSYVIGHRRRIIHRGFGIIIDPIGGVKLLIINHLNNVLTINNL